MKKFALFVMLISLTLSVRAQRTCATTELEQLNKSPEQIKLERDQFENWLIEKRIQLVTKNAFQGLTEITIYQIPVVVHVIHNGEKENDGINISDEQIVAQIAALNIDFRHFNADSVNTPLAFQPLMADIGFEFVLALRDPNGLPTNGITRTEGTKTTWAMSDNTELKMLSYWSTDDYFNIWVAPLGTNLLGWAEYPTSSTLSGLDGAKDNALTDGVVINTLAFGSSELYPQGNYFNNFDLGRTATHEVGHFFGLRHIWGDGGCTVDDYVTDTPKTSSSNNFCPSPGSLANSCSTESSMFMNYMDYVNDDCMNLFSLGQKERMVVIVNNSPRRASLLTSVALEPPPTLDAGITAIPSPVIGICDNQISPTVTVLNAGVAPITQVTIRFSLNQVAQGQQTFPISLTSVQDTTLLLTAFSLVQFGEQELTAEIIMVNGVNDMLLLNNTFTKEVFYSEVVSTLHEEFTSWPASWAIRSEAPVSEWNFLQAPNVVIENTAAVLTYHENNSPFTDHLLSPILDLTSYTNPYLLFDYAYGEVIGIEDMLAITVSLDCGNTFPDTLFLKSGNELATTEIPVRFTPSGPIDWQTGLLDLSAYNSQNIQVAFVGKSAGGNNIYLDNFFLVDDGYEDISIKGLLNESAVYSSAINAIGLIIENTGVTTVNNIGIELKEGINNISQQDFSNLNLGPGQRKTLFIDHQLGSGIHNLTINHLLNDEVSANNQLLITANILDSKEQIPFRERFNSATWNNLNKWSIYSPIDNIAWQSWPETNDFLHYPAKTPGNAGLHDWLVLPLLDFSEANVAAIQYKLAYANNSQNNELLKIWVSTNNGESFDYLIESLTSEQMASVSATSNWTPATEDDWTNRFIDLSEFAGEENVLIAFETIDGDGNNIFLDDVELFISDEPNIIAVEEDKLAIYPNPVSSQGAHITFNLATKQDVRIRIIDVQGKELSNQQFTNVLNQTYPLEISTQRNGIYLIQATGHSFTTVTRILVNN